MQMARELYGAGGYWEFTGYPDLKPRNMPDPAQANDALVEFLTSPRVCERTDDDKTLVLALRSDCP